MMKDIDDMVNNIDIIFHSRHRYYIHIDYTI